MNSENHQASAVWTTEDGKHYHACLNGCDAHLDEAPCSYTTATCTSLATCTVCSTATGELDFDNHSGTLSDGEYLCCHRAELINDVWQIKTAQNMVWFAKYVNAGHTGANAVLLADLDMSGVAWEPISQTDSYHTSDATVTDAGYRGTFDGSGHVISNLTVNGGDEGVLSYGLFGTLSGTVKKLGLDHYTFLVGKADCRAGGIAGQVLTGGLITDCYVINSEVLTGTRIAGTIAGCNYGGTIQSCYAYHCNVTGHARCAAIVGDSKDDGGGKIGSVSHCYTDSAKVVGSQNGGEDYVVSCQAGMDEAAFASGEVAYLLNEGRETAVWKLKNGMPSWEGDVVYRNTCEDCFFYTTNDTDYAVHSLGQDFRCTVCGCYDTPEKDENGVYQITTASQLFWFADQVNSGNKAISAMLMNDINLNGVEWAPIGNASIYYGVSGSTSVFDGNGKKIEGLYIIAETQNVGLFGHMAYCEIKNFTIYGEIRVTSASASNIGTFGAVSTGAKIIGVHSYVNITFDSGLNWQSSAGGIAGHLCYGGAVYKSAYYGTIDMADNKGDQVGGVTGYILHNGTNIVENCAMYGTIKCSYNGAPSIGGVVAYVNNGSTQFKNLLFAGKLEMGENVDTTNVSAIGFIKSVGTVSGLYYPEDMKCLATDSTYTVTGTAYTAEQLASGHVTYLLNGSTSTPAEGESLVWYQTCYVGLPTFSGDVVYQVSATYCDGTTVTEYANTDQDITDAHAWDEGEITKQPTCMEQGVKTYTCMHDSSHTKTEPVAINPDNHNFGEWTVTKEATATEAGEQTRTCVCGHTQTEAIPATGTTGGDSTGDDTVGCNGCGSVIGGISAGAVALGGAGTFLFIKKRKRK